MQNREGTYAVQEEENTAELLTRALEIFERLSEPDREAANKYALQLGK